MALICWIKKMCESIVEKYPGTLGNIPDCFKTQGMCIKAVEKDPRMIGHIPNDFKSWEM